MSNHPGKAGGARGELVQSGLLALMVTAQVAGLIFVFQLVAPGFPTFTVTTLVLLVCWEALATTRWLEHRDRMLVDATLYRCAELITVLVTVRVVVWIANDELPGLKQLVDYIADPTSMFFHRDFILGLVVVLIAWVRACHFGGVFRELGVSEDEAAIYAEYRANRHDFPAGPPLDRNRGRIAKDFQRSWAWGGVFLVICAAVATFDLTGIETGEQVPAAYMTLTLVSYFFTGIWLASAARHQALHAKWLLTGTGKRGGVITRWRKSTGWLIAGIAGVVSFLPAGGLLPVAEILHFCLNGVLFLANFILLLFAQLIGLLTGLFNREQTDVMVEDDLPGALLPDVAQAAQNTAPDALIAPPDLGPLLWLLLVGLAALAFAYFVHERSQSWPSDLRKLLVALWRWLLESGKSQTGASRRPVYPTEAMAGESIAPKKRTRRPRRFLLGLNRAGQIRELYRRLVEEAAKRHAHRLASQTPLEYQHVLAARWPEQASEIKAITDGFVKARYTRSEIPSAQVRAIKRIYRKLRTVFRKKPSG